MTNGNTWIWPTRSSQTTQQIIANLMGTARIATTPLKSFAQWYGLKIKESLQLWPLTVAQPRGNPWVYETHLSGGKHTACFEAEQRIKLSPKLRLSQCIPKTCPRFWRPNQRTSFQPQHSSKGVVSTRCAPCGSISTLAIRHLIGLIFSMSFLRETSQPMGSSQLKSCNCCYSSMIALEAVHWHNITEQKCQCKLYRIV